MLLACRVQITRRLDFTIFEGKEYVGPDLPGKVFLRHGCDLSHYTGGDAKQLNAGTSFMKHFIQQVFSL